jgi:hypothetical protein
LPGSPGRAIEGLQRRTVIDFADRAEPWNREGRRRQKNLWQKDNGIACQTSIFVPQIFLPYFFLGRLFASLGAQSPPLLA